MSTPRTLYDKLWDDHVVRIDENGAALLYIDRHLVHEVTSPQAFEGLRIAERQPWRLQANLAVPDHNVLKMNALVASVRLLIRSRGYKSKPLTTTVNPMAYPCLK